MCCENHANKRSFNRDLTSDRDLREQSLSWRCPTVAFALTWQPVKEAVPATASA